jgi:hypothetical protein
LAKTEVPFFWDDDGSHFASSELVEGRIREAFHPEQHDRIGTISIYGHPIRAGINPACKGLDGDEFSIQVTYFIDSSIIFLNLKSKKNPIIQSKIQNPCLPF